MTILEKAIHIAVDAHSGQRDKAGQPYILHPLRIMLKMKTETEKIAAVLHDVIEDTDWTFEKLKREGFSEEILDALKHVTRQRNETYEQFIERVKTNPTARQVKISDLEDNMDIKRLSVLTDQDLQRLNKYRKALKTLTGD